MYCERAENSVWIGDTKNNGLAIFAWPEIALKKLERKYHIDYIIDNQKFSDKTKEY